MKTMKAKIKCMVIKYVETFMDDETGNWFAVEGTRDVDGFEGRVTRAAAERELAKLSDCSDNVFYNIISVSAVTKTIEI